MHSAEAWLTRLLTYVSFAHVYIYIWFDSGALKCSYTCCGTGQCIRSVSITLSFVICVCVCCMSVCMHACVCVCVCVRACVCMRVHTCISVCKHTCLCVHILACVYVLSVVTYMCMQWDIQSLGRLRPSGISTTKLPTHLVPPHKPLCCEQYRPPNQAHHTPSPTLQTSKQE